MEEKGGQVVEGWEGERERPDCGEARREERGEKRGERKRRVIRIRGWRMHRRRKGWGWGRRGGKGVQRRERVKGGRKEGVKERGRRAWEVGGRGPG
jgi:hypothetical protein